MMEDYSDRYGNSLIKLIDSRATRKEFEFDQTMLMPTAKCYRALVDEARTEIKPKVMNYLLTIWPEGAIENLSFFAMAAAVYARSISEPPHSIDVGRSLLKTAAFCNLRCSRRKETGGGCLMAMNKGQHYLPKCVKIPRDIAASWGYVKRYIATGGAVCSPAAIGVQDAMGVKVQVVSNFAPAASC